ncbi:MAG: hypothetical protein JNN06_12015 [Gemmobacter sp.]|uniref:hypothetical protein n=1 Tax=Gemmobacter sp. TaxID=1898957 RepID=UPI001A471DCA|nr:hypothetical protein [Gemmobacter sp.]MBL8562995.1 hypothetical protein [Gemmobacter sp.]
MLNALKRRIARYMADRGYVRHLVKESLEHDPAFMDRLREQIREEVLRDSSFLRLIAAIIKAEPERLRGISRAPQVFQALLAELGNNPEALYLMLQRAPLRLELQAQGAFLTTLAEDPKIMRALLRLLPADQGFAALQALLEVNADEGRAQGLGAALAQSRLQSGKVPVGPLQVLSLLLADQEGTFAAALPRDDVRAGAALLADRCTRSGILAALAADHAALAELIEYVAIQPLHGDSVARRLQRLLDLLIALPAFGLSVRQDAMLQERLLAMLQEAAQSKGQTLAEVVASR